ncbi:DUF6683 family protein [Pelagibacterium sp. H642]|uniref:DUF6683 family protein n=1 Tax=Pelagibacterium sp. H642 TaxID=1881069 RepID=UPI0028154C99|nr:DUF6683 family protein [Pelagibacterium sp. H642]WMT92005.1 hypothetical protein NO934_07040 [Pelagibacterium sp. H642]
MHKTVSAFLVFAAMVLPAHAQDYPFQGFATDITMNTLHSTMLNATIQSSLDDAASAPAAPVDPNLTVYTATPDVSARAQEQFIAFVEETSGTLGADAVRKQFAKRSPVESWAELVATDGLRPGDAADAIAGYWALNWIIANRAHEETFPVAPIAEQVRASLAADGQWVGLADAQKQEISEVLMMNFLLQQAVYSDALMTGNMEMMGALSQAAVTRFQNDMGVDLRAIVPSSSGFVSR